MSNLLRFALSEICENITDGSHFSPKLTNDGYPYITVRDIVEDSINFADCKYVNEQDYRQLAGNGCKPSKGDVLFSKDGTVGKVALVDTSREFVVLSSLAILRPNQSRVFPPYLKYALKSPEFLKVALGKKTGAAIRRIILRNLKSIEIPLPTLAEQKRIVALLDEAFAGIDEAKANAEANQSNSEGLYKSYLQSALSNGNESWPKRSLEDLLNCGWIEGHLDGNHGSDYPKKEEFVDQGVPYISANCLQDEEIDMTRAKHLSTERAARLRKGIAKNHDVLFAHNATVGPVALL
jgi:type I restriction enzyme S subunit